MRVIVSKAHAGGRRASHRALIGEAEIRHFLPAFLVRVAALAFSVALASAAHTVTRDSVVDGGQEFRGGDRTMVTSTR